VKEKKVNIELYSIISIVFYAWLLCNKKTLI